ncbi:MAG: hypothetical protein P8048_13415, partial [Calditrichia bacterium]
EITNIFVPKNETVVQTRGAHERDTKFKTTENPLLPDAGLVVLVDGGSAALRKLLPVPSRIWIAVSSSAPKLSERVWYSRSTRSTKSTMLS